MNKLEISVAFGDLVSRLVAIFEQHGCSSNVARVLAANCASAERDGATSHGVFRMQGYVSTLRSGWVDGQAVPRIEDVAPGFVRVDAENGFAQPALLAARELLIRKARENGIAAVAIRRSHHFGALSLDVEPLADEGLLALAVVNSDKAVVPFGARRAVYGTNPIAFAVPRERAPPMVIDLATSTIAHGEVAIAARENRKVIPGTGLNARGDPTIEPSDILNGGALLTFGGHKGSSIALIVEILCAGLGGGKFSFEANPPRELGAQTPNTGQTVIAIDPTTGRAGERPFSSRIEDLLSELLDAGQSRLPGDRRRWARERSIKDGVPLSRDTLDTLDRLRALAAPGAKPTKHSTPGSLQPEHD